MRIRSILFVTAALFSIAAIPRSAAAYDVKAQLTNTYNYSVGASVSADAGSNYVGTTTGVFNWTRLDGNGGPPPASFQTFCIEIIEHISFGGTYEFDRVNLNTAPDTSPMGPDRAAFLKQLWTNEYVNDGGITSGTEAAAFQFAVWEIVYDGARITTGPNTNKLVTTTGFATTGNFRGTSSDSGAVSLAETWLGALNLGLGGFSTLSALTDAVVHDPGYVNPQDQVFFGDSGAFVPLPGAAASVVPVMMLLGGALKSKRRQHREEELANS